MADHLLYFPYINLPENNWTFRSLLYYDTISAIVPSDHVHNPNLLDPFMRELVRENLVIPLDPMETLDRPGHLTKPFMDFIQAPGYGINLKRQNFNNQQQGSQRPYGHTFSGHHEPSLISREKFNADLMYNLQKLGLARPHHDNFYEVEKTTANYLMSYLSNIVADKLELLPVTDIGFKRPSFMLSYKKKPIDEQVTIRRNTALAKIMPGPAYIELAQLLDFKIKYQNELRVFRNVIEQIALDDRYDNEELMRNRVEELNQYKELLTARMTESNWKDIVFNTVFGLINAVIGISTVGNLKGAILGAPGFINSVYSALKLENPEKIYDTTGMKYLALVHKKL
ncbi:kinase [Pedobacter sp. ASV28]|uniref:kinase n=1 Tax=Pedobacter sp. ASV28 TaxID=2795123 RepID=UPI0018ED5871|nr:kinase [Pedobacter sp. ASV28]